MSAEHKVLITSDVLGNILMWKREYISRRFTLVCVAKKSVSQIFKIKFFTYMEIIKVN